MSHRAIFTHNDLDGLACALVARVAMPGCNVYFCDYAGLPRVLAAKLARFDEVWLADMSIKAGDEAVELLRSADADVYYFDHHDSSLEQPWMARCLIDRSSTRCSAEVIRDFIVAERDCELPVALQTLVEWTHDQDLWVRAIPESQDLNDILGHMQVQELFDLLSADPNRLYHFTPRMREASQATQRQREWSHELAQQTSVWSDLPGGGRLRAACCWGSVSEVGDLLGDAETLVALLDLRNVERGHARFSFRTQSDTLASNKLAELLGGGGHPKASGAPLEIDLFKVLSTAIGDKIRDAAAQLAASQGET